jgi:glycosyltransferase involved in cell wall biosynthesis
MREARFPVSVVIPAYNEASRIAASLRTIDTYARSISTPFELIVVDDGSRDGTADVARANLPTASNVKARVLRYDTNRGKGYAVRHGLLEARAPIALFSDADQSTPIEEIVKLVEPIERGETDVTFGSRALNRGLIGVRQPLRRELGGRAFNLVLRTTTGLPFVDTQCGFKAFRMSVCRPLLESATIDGFGFDIELLYAAHRAQLRLQEIPVRWNHCEGSKVRFLSDGTRMLRDILTVRMRGASGFYDYGIHQAGAAARRERVRPLPGRALA